MKRVFALPAAYLALLPVLALLVLALASNTQPADPASAVLELTREVFYGTDHGTICVQIYTEVSPPTGIPEPNIPGYTVVHESATGEPGKVIATRILRQD